jgi:hypothetical protein
MARPMKWRKVCCLPESNRFGPLDSPADTEDHVNMTVDEYETIRLKGAERTQSRSHKKHKWPDNSETLCFKVIRPFGSSSRLRCSVCFAY